MGRDNNGFFVISGTKVPDAAAKKAGHTKFNISVVYGGKFKIQLDALMVETNKIRNLKGTWTNSSLGVVGTFDCN